MNTVEHKYLTTMARGKLWTKKSAESVTKGQYLDASFSR